MSRKTEPHSLCTSENRAAFAKGMKDGLPIGLGYFAVSFSLGIAARNAGLTPFQGLLTSLLCNTSAGEYAGFTLIAAGASLLEVAVMTLVVNARYLLMSIALSQRLHPETSILHRMCMVYDLSDEIFAVSVARPGYLSPNYTYGVTLAAAPFWAVGTALGCLTGNLIPIRWVSAFSVALFGMFLAVIIPPARKNKVIAATVLLCFIASYAAEHLPVISDISGGTRTIILTVGISAAAAILFPKEKESEVQ